MIKKIGNQDCSLATGFTSWSAQLSFVTLSNELKIEELYDNFDWDQVLASNFIDSILFGIPIPSIYICLYKGEKIVVDGLQRIVTVHAYCNNILLASSGNFALDVPTNRQWYLKSFDELGSIQKKAILSTTVTTYIIDVKDNRRLLLEIFNKINPSKVSRIR